MNNQLKGWIRSFLSLNKSEQRGIIVLTTLILVVGVINLILPYIVKPEISPQFSINMKIVNDFIADKERINDSIKLLESLKSKNAINRNKLFKFDPNTTPDSIFSLFGLSKNQIANIRNYILKGGRFYRKSDLKKIYTISDEDYLILEPYIFIKTKGVNPDPDYSKTYINTANKEALIQNLMFSPYMASRIIKFRDLLGGYYSKEQLYEVYGIDSSHLRKIDSYIEVDTDQIEKININAVVFKDLLRHPYFDYNTTKEIMNVRSRVGAFQSLEHIKREANLSDSAFSRQKYYLYIRPHKIKTDTL